MVEVQKDWQSVPNMISVANQRYPIICLSIALWEMMPGLGFILGCLRQPMLRFSMDEQQTLSRK